MNSSTIQCSVLVVVVVNQCRPFKICFATFSPHIFWNGSCLSGHLAFWLPKSTLYFLLSSHKLQIETGRFLRPAVQRNQRYFVFCLSQGCSTVGDESHALDSCSQFPGKRKSTWTKGESKSGLASGTNKGISVVFPLLHVCYFGT